jgi:DNA-binding NtrC family response regulator
VTVLLVEDDRDALRLISHHVKSEFGDSITLIEEQDSTRAASVIDSRRIHLLVTDLDMANKNGFHLLKTAKMRDPLTQVLVVTGHRSGNAIRSAVMLGADDFIVKPYHPKDLLQTVKHLIERLKRWSVTINEVDETPVGSV